MAAGAGIHAGVPVHENAGGCLGLHHGAMRAG